MKTRSLRRKRLFGNLLTYCIVAAAFVILQLLNAGGMLSPSLQGQLVPICAYVTMAVALNLVVGISGELSLGHAGFMSIGAFAGSAFAIAMQDAVGFSPLRLALAVVAAGREGAELFIGYADRGAGTAGAAWLAEEPDKAR